MPKSNPNFIICLGVMISTLLGSTRPKDTNLHISFLVLSLEGPEISKVTQKFPKK